MPCWGFTAGQTGSLSIPVFGFQKKVNKQLNALLGTLQLQFDRVYCRKVNDGVKKTEREEFIKLAELQRTHHDPFWSCVLAKAKVNKAQRGRRSYLQYTQSVSPVDTLTVPHQEAPVSTGSGKQLLGRRSTQVPVIPHRRCVAQRRSPTAAAATTTPGHGHSPSNRVKLKLLPVSSEKTPSPPPV